METCFWIFWKKMEIKKFKIEPRWLSRLTGSGCWLGRLCTPSGPGSISGLSRLASTSDFFSRVKLLKCLCRGSGGSDSTLNCIRASWEGYAPHTLLRGSGGAMHLYYRGTQHIGLGTQPETYEFNIARPLTLLVDSSLVKSKGPDLSEMGGRGGGLRRFHSVSTLETVSENKITW